MFLSSAVFTYQNTNITI
uniref:Uncharacterized protein n=1 Tax=Arundo donax TaxID=35708 RepID=A0A0A9AAC1_ARUDO